MTKTLSFQAELDSTHISAASYDSRLSVLVIRFSDGSKYAYGSVTPGEALGLLQATSAGNYFNLKIKQKTFIKVSS